jgi:hypothetical protein
LASFAVDRAHEGIARSPRYRAKRGYWPTTDAAHNQTQLLQEIKLVIVDAADRTKVIEHDGVSNEPVLIEDKKED